MGKSQVKLLLLILMPALLTALAVRNISAEFLIDEYTPEAGKDIKVPGAKKKKKSGELPAYIATNITAEKIAAVKGAIRVSWKISEESEDDFIVGRSNRICNTQERALNAVSIKILPPTGDSSIIDSNLPPGEYYYVVLAKNKVMNKDVEIYPNVNYTTRPVIIEGDTSEKIVSTYPEQVTLIHAQLINKTNVLLTWKGIEQQGIVYTVYRSRERLDSIRKIKRAEIIATITDGRESYIDRGISDSDTYYYAVTTKDISGNEDLQLIPDQSYLTQGLFVPLLSRLTVSNLRIYIRGRSVHLKWDGIDNPDLDYIIYRYTRSIENPKRLAMAEIIGRTSSQETNFTDDNPNIGNNYYAVLVWQSDSTINNTLKEGENYTRRPVKIIPDTMGKKYIVKDKSGKRIDGEDKLDSADRIIRETFFKGEYRHAIKKLQVIMNSSDNELEVAKAGLFIGRSLIELGKYEKSLSYFVTSEVTRYFPRESKFWKNYALMRVRGQ